MSKETSVPTLALDFIWKPTDREFDLLLQTILPESHPFEVEGMQNGNPLFRFVEVDVPIKVHVLRKLQVLADHFEMSVSHLISRLLDMEVTQYGQFDLQHRLQLVSTSQH